MHDREQCQILALFPCVADYAPEFQRLATRRNSFESLVDNVELLRVSFQ